MRIRAAEKVLKLSESIFGTRVNRKAGTRRKSDAGTEAVESVVLKALHLMAKRSSPHRATTRASMARAISLIEASLLGLRHIEELVDECVTQCHAGLETEDKSKRAALAERYSAIIVELNAIAKGTGHAGHHLIGDESSSLVVDPGSTDASKLKLPQINLTAGASGLALPKPSHVFEEIESLKQFDRHLSLVKDRLARSRDIFEAHAADIATRLALLLEGAYAMGDELDDGPTTPARQPAPMEREV